MRFKCKCGYLILNVTVQNRVKLWIYKNRTTHKEKAKTVGDIHPTVLVIL